ncbi:MAG: YbbR-like domain-containing protein [Salinimicrobium sp.]
MLKRIKTVSKARFKRTNFNSFLFFLFFAVIIWIFVQFSKQYNEIINIPVQYVNVPPDKLLSENNPKQLKLRMEENGFRIAWKSLFPPTLYIDMDKTVPSEGKLLYVIDDNRSDIISQLNIDFEDSRFVKEVLAIDFKQKAERKLPVRSRIEVDYAAGYSASKELQLKPDSVKVSGPDALLDTLSSLQTVKLKLKKVKNDISGTVALDTSSYKGLTLYTTKVKYSAEVEKFTEGSVTVPIELINAPEGMDVVIFPKETLLFYQVNLKDYNKITASDFRVVADFSEVRENQNFLIANIIKQPDFTTNLRLNEKKIQFIIKK